MTTVRSAGSDSGRTPLHDHASERTSAMLIRVLRRGATRDRVRLAVLALLALIGLGPAEGSSSRLFQSHAHAAPVLSIDGAPANSAALFTTVARTVQMDLGLPLPARITARIYEGPAPFEEGLTTYGAVPAAQAAELARFAIGAAIPGTVLLVAPASASAPSLEWPRLIAHELTHLAQMELAATETGPAQWLVEGMAEWVAYRVLARLGLVDFETWSVGARTAAVDYVVRAAGLNLEALATPSGFLAHHQRVGPLLTYRLALHLTDRLVEREGMGALVGYFRAFRASSDPALNFRTSFGISLGSFERAMLGCLTGDRERPAAGAPCLRPQPAA